MSFFFVLDETESQDESPRGHYFDDDIFSSSDDDILSCEPFRPTSDFNNQLSLFNNASQFASSNFNA
jgi:hypothetical protein